MASRITLIGRLQDKATQRTWEKFAGAWKTLVQHLSQIDGNVTGILLVYPQTFLVVCEMKGAIVNKFVRTVEDNLPQLRVPQLKVASCAEDIPHAAYTAWYSAFVDTLGSADVKAAPDTGKAVQQAAATVQSTLQLGGMLAKLTELELQSALHSMASFHEELPTSEALQSLLLVEDIPTTKDFLQLFDTPLNV